MYFLLDRFVPDALSGDPDGLRRGRILTGTAFGLALALVIGLAARIAIAGHDPAAVALSAFCAAVFAASPWLLRATGSLAVAGAAVTVGLLLLIVGVGWLVGGLDGPVLMAAPLLPIVATHLLGRRVGALALGLLLAAVALYAVLPRLGVEIPPSPLAWLEEVTLRGVALGLTVILAGLFAAFSEGERIRAEAKLRRSEEMHRKLFEQSHDIVTMSTVAGNLVDVNQAGVDFWGTGSKEELLARNVAAGYADPQQREALLERLAADGYVRDYETTQRTGSGELRVLQGTTSTIRGEDGSVELLLAIFRDVTDRRRAEAEREALVAELADKNAELEHFTYAVSHDLKSPLTTIRGFAGLMRQDAATGRTGRLERYAMTIDQAADKMGRMIADLLSFCRLGRRQVSRGEVSLGQVAREAAELLAGAIGEAGTAVEIGADLPRVRGDHALLRTVFQNLIDNAVKFSAGSPGPKVTIGARDGGGETVVTVRDNGAGIAPEYQEKIFELFQKLDARKGGSGVGLASVRRAVELHGGRVWVESEGEGCGSTFCFTIPATGAVTDSGEATASRVGPSTGAAA